MLTLTASRRRELTALAHTLNPIVVIGKVGLSDNVINELDRSLLSHELIKVKAGIDDRIARELLFAEICQKLGAEPIKHIGKTFIIYRPKPEEMEKVQAVTRKRKKREPRRAKRSFQA